jgi:hypothetical protein
VQSHSQRLQQSADIQAQFVWKFITPFRWVINPLLQRALEMWKRLSRAPELHVFANVISAFFTSLTLFARDANFERYFVAWLEV